MEYRQDMTTQEKYSRAEKQVFAGVYGRLFARYISMHAEGYASYLALAVTGEILSYPSDNEKLQSFKEKNQAMIDMEIEELKKDKTSEG